MQQKPRGAALAFGRGGVGGGVGRCDVHSTPSASRPDRAGSSAETTADPAGANNCFLSAGISVASSEDKPIALWGRGTLTWLQPTTCLPPKSSPLNNSSSEQHIQSTKTLHATFIQYRPGILETVKFQFCVKMLQVLKTCQTCLW